MMGTRAHIHSAGFEHLARHQGGARYWTLPPEAPEVRHVPRRCLHGRPLRRIYTRIARAPVVRCGTEHALMMRRVRIALFGLLVAGKGMHSFCTGVTTLDPECTSL